MARRSACSWLVTTRRVSRIRDGPRAGPQAVGQQVRARAAGHLEDLERTAPGQGWLIAFRSYRTGSGLRLLPRSACQEARHVVSPGAAVPPQRPRSAHPARQRSCRGGGAGHERVGEHRAELAGAPPGEFIEDPWVSERVTLVAEQAGRIAAAAHLLRYFPDERAGVDARDAGEICWLLFWPQVPAGNPYWPDATAAAEALMAACGAQFGSWGVSRQYAGGELPVPGVYGVPEQWPHVAGLYQRAGFRHTGQTEVVYLARVQDLPDPAGPAGRGADGAAVGGDQRLPPVRRARPGGDRLHRGRDPRRRPAAVPARRVGRRRQPACHAAVPAPWRRYLAARAGRRLAPAGRGQPASRPTPGWRAPTRAG